MQPICAVRVDAHLVHCRLQITERAGALHQSVHGRAADIAEHPRVAHWLAGRQKGEQTAVQAGQDALQRADALINQIQLSNAALHRLALVPQLALEGLLILLHNLQSTSGADALLAALCSSPVSAQLLVATYLCCGSASSGLALGLFI